jgi:hypothetical protein
MSKPTFLNGFLLEEVHMEQLVGFVEPGAEHKICLLKRSLHSLKQSPRAWYNRITQFLCNGNL